MTFHFKHPLKHSLIVAGQFDIGLKSPGHMTQKFLRQKHHKESVK